MFENIQTRYRSRLITAVLIVCSTFHVARQDEMKDGIIYILSLARKLRTPFTVNEMGRTYQKCAFKNCFFTDDPNYFESILQFEVIIFDVVYIEYYKLPTTRSQRQKYILYGIEPSMRNYVPQSFDRYFNLTFTYKLTSNITIPYVVVKNENDDIVGPELDMQWMALNEMNNVSEFVKNKLQNKRFAAAWLVSNCNPTWRNLYAQFLKKDLARYGHSLHIYGKCGTFVCSTRDETETDDCSALIESDYYFYLAFENSLSEDYVSEKILHALEHYAVPVVMGGANYSRFMPEGIYLDANVLQADKLAEIMNEAITDKNKYYEFFRWHDHYSFHFSGEDRYSDEICKLCTYLNNNRNRTSTLENISEWWNEENSVEPVENNDIVV